jgi:hypothetical protein
MEDYVRDFSITEAENYLKKAIPSEHLHDPHERIPRVLCPWMNRVFK